MVHSLGNTDAKGGAKSQMRKHLQHLCKTSVYFHNRKMSKTNENNAQSNTTFREFFIVIIFLNYCFNLHRKPLTVNSNQLHNSSWFHVSGNYFFFFIFCSLHWNFWDDSQTVLMHVMLNWSIEPFSKQICTYFRTIYWRRLLHWTVCSWQITAASESTNTAHYNTKSSINGYSTVATREQRS